jgi:hypothetical protein
VWSGSCWLADDDAVEFILSLEGDDPSLLPNDLPSETNREEPASRRSIGRLNCGTGALERRIAAYAAKLPNLGEGQGRDDVAYHFACWLVRDLQLPNETALDWLQRWDKGNTPPKGEARLKEILASAHQYGQRAYGSGLSSPPARTARRSRHSHIRFVVEI